MKSSVLRGVSVLVAAGVLVTATPVTGYAAKTTKQLAKEYYAEFLKKNADSVKEYAVVDFTGDKIPELLCKSSGYAEVYVDVYVYNKKDDCVDSIDCIRSTNLRYDASKRVLGSCANITEELDGEGGKLDYLDETTCTAYDIVAYDKNGEVKSIDSGSKSYTTYTSKYKPETEYYPSKSKYESMKKKFKAIKNKVKFVKNNSANRKKLK